LLKFLVIILSALSLDEQDKLTRNLKEIIRFEITAIIYKLLLGFVITATVIFSLFQFGQKTKIILDKFENGIGLQLLSFGSVSLVGLFLLYFLFRRYQVSPSIIKDSDQSAIDLQEMGMKFSQGLIEGYNTHKKSHQTEEEKHT
jgi:hypothetical protein